MTRIAVLLLAFTVAGSGQRPCTKKLAEAPSLSRFKLGMSYGEVQKIIPVFKGMIYLKDGGTVFENFVDRPPPQTLIGVRALYLRFFKDRIYQVEVFYEEKGSPTKLEDFTGQLSADLGLTSEAWTVKNGWASLKCEGFSITADMVVNPHAELTDTASRTELDKKQQSEKSVKKKKS